MSKKIETAHIRMLIDDLVEAMTELPQEASYSRIVLKHVLKVMVELVGTEHTHLELSA